MTDVIITGMTGLSGLSGMAGLAPRPSGPVLSSVSPSSCYLQGNTRVVVTGSGFTGATAVTFGGVRAQWFYVIDDTHLACSPFPVASGATVNLAITNGTTATISFTFNAATVGTTKTAYDTTDTHDVYSIGPGPDGNTWWGTAGGSDVGKMTSAGTPTVYSGTLIDTVAAVVTSPDGGLWVISWNHVNKVTTSGVVTTYALPGSLGANGQAFGGCLGPNGSLWVPYQNYTGTDFLLWKIDPDGTVTSYVHATAGSGDGDDAYAVIGICMGKDGYLWAIGQHQKLLKIDPANGNILNVYDLEDGIDPGGIIVGSDGFFWTFYCNFDAPRIFKIDPAAPSVVIEYALDALFLGINYVAAGTDGKIWFSGGNGTNLGYAQAVTTGGTVGSLITNSTAFLTQVCGGSTGAMWFAGNIDKTLIKVT